MKILLTAALLSAVATTALAQYRDPYGICERGCHFDERNGVCSCPQRGYRRPDRYDPRTVDPLPDCRRQFPGSHNCYNDPRQCCGGGD
jgi:hypothetical protein